MIYIQSNPERTLPHHFDAACAMYGAIETGQKYRLTSFEEVQSGKFDMSIPKFLFVGSVEFMREVFSRRGLIDVRLSKNSNREESIISLGEALERQRNGERLFIKPYDIKLFSGTILDGVVNSQIEGLSKETKVIVADVFHSPIASEWRCYVDNRYGVITGLKNYSGDHLTFPSEITLLEWVHDINHNNSFPVSYTIDVGILEDGTNVVIEYNDMWAIGNYGLENDVYLNMLKNRYFEIINNI